MGSVQTTLNDAGSVLTNPQYDAWGTVTSTTIPAPFGFTGEYRDASSGFSYLRARWYNPSTGTLLGRDPFDGYAHYPASLNPYMYAWNDPVFWNDPSGKCPVWEEDCDFLGWQALDLTKWDWEGGLNSFGDSFRAIGSPGMLVSDWLTGRNDFREFWSDVTPAKAAGGAFLLLATGAQAPAAYEALGTSTIYAQSFLVASPKLAMGVTAFGMILSVSDDTVLVLRMTTGNEQERADAFGQYQIGAQDGVLPFADTVAACSMLFTMRPRKLLIPDGKGGGHIPYDLDGNLDVVQKALQAGLPQRNGIGKTTGFLFDNNGSLLTKIESGNTISLPPAQRSMIRDPENELAKYSEGALEFLHHVESKASRYMSENGINDATLVSCSPEIHPYSVRE